MGSAAHAKSPEMTIEEEPMGGGVPHVPVLPAETLAALLDGRDPLTLEGWFVDAAHRRSGVGAALVRAAEAWGRAQGCTEFASDADPANAVSIDAHLALGFEDTGLVRCFRKSLTD